MSALTAIRVQPITEQHFGIQAMPQHLPQANGAFSHASISSVWSGQTEGDLRGLEQNTTRLSEPYDFSRTALPHQFNQADADCLSGGAICS